MSPNLVICKTSSTDGASPFLMSWSKKKSWAFNTKRRNFLSSCLDSKASRSRQSVSWTQVLRKAYYFLQNRHEFWLGWQRMLLSKYFLTQVPRCRNLNNHIWCSSDGSGKDDMMILQMFIAEWSLSQTKWICSIIFYVNNEVTPSYEKVKRDWSFKVLSFGCFSIWLVIIEAK